VQTPLLTVDSSVVKQAAPITYVLARRYQTDRARYDRAIKALKFTGPDMETYRLTFNPRRFESIYGTAYPYLRPLDSWTKRKILYNLIQSVGIEQPSIDIEIKEGTLRSFFMKQFEVAIRQRGKRGYDSAIATEKWVRNIPRVSFMGPPRFWNRLIPGRRPTDTFMINELNIAEVYKWLREHVTHRDYQMFTKFSEDISLGFRNPEHATLFKLTFGDKNI
jgi:hypothetical protein